MLAGPPPTFSPGPLPTTMPPETQLSSSSSTRFRAPILPPNLTGNIPPPSLPPNFPNNQTVPIHATPPPPFNNTSTVSNNQQTFKTSGPMITDITNASLPSQTQLNAGQPISSALNPAMPLKAHREKGYDTPSTMADAYYPNLPSSHLPPPPPPPPHFLPNSHYPSIPNTNGVLSHSSNHYPRGPTPNYTSPNPTAPPEGLPTQPHYPNLVGPYANRPVGSSTPSGQPPAIAPPAPSTRIDPDMVPNVIQVLEQSQEKIQEPFITNAPGLLPPLAGTNFVCQDQGSCNPRLMRSTIYTIPNANDLVKQSQIPLALAISPLANVRPDELEPPLANYGEIGPIRCHRCKAYMCSFMKFIDGGKRFTCCFCEAATDVPNEYFNHLDHTGRRLDHFQRPELCLGSYEVLATKQYCKDEKLPQTPAFIFMIDVSYNSVRSGLLAYICRLLKDNLLDYLPMEKNEKSSLVRVGFITYDKQIHFYNIKHTLTQPQMMVTSDFEEVFVPLVDGFLCSPYESRGVINSLLDQIPQTFANTHETETILAPVIQSGIEALKAANRTGKIFLFSSSLPNANAPGKLTNRDDKKLLGTEKEKTLLSPVANNIYTKLGEDCAQNGCAVDLFAFPNSYYDLATIGEICRISGGEIYKFNYFSIENDGERLYDELKRNFQRTTAFDALMRVRTSAGIRPVDFLGNFYMTNATEMIFGTIDADKSVAVELKHDDKLPPDTNTYVQAALLYTSLSGQRRLRILTLELTVSSTYTSLYPACDLDTILNYITKVAVRSVLISTPKSIRDNIIAQAANMLACYRKYCAQATTSGQLILPETLKLLPIYVASLIKSDVLTGNQLISTDDRSALIHRLMSLNIKGTSAYLYPRIYQLNNLNENTAQPTMIRCSYERLLDTGVYVLENGLALYIWLGGQVDPLFVQSLFNVQSASQIQNGNCHIPDLDNSISKNVRTLLNNIRNERNSFMKFTVVQQRDSAEFFFKNYLVEDKGVTNGASYIDFLFHLHREIRNILS